MQKKEAHCLVLTWQELEILQKSVNKLLSGNRKEKYAKLVEISSETEAYIVDLVVLPPLEKTDG